MNYKAHRAYRGEVTDEKGKVKARVCAWCDPDASVRKSIKASGGDFNTGICGRCQFTVTVEHVRRVPLLAF